MSDTKNITKVVLVEKKHDKTRTIKFRVINPLFLYQFVLMNSSMVFINVSIELLSLLWAGACLKHAPIYSYHAIIYLYRKQEAFLEW